MKTYPLVNKVYPSIFKVGDWVKSQYRARWKGVVIASQLGCTIINNCAHYYWDFKVQQLIDRRGNPIRKKKVVNYSSGWFVRTNPVEGVCPTVSLQRRGRYEK